MGPSHGKHACMKLVTPAKAASLPFAHARVHVGLGCNVSFDHQTSCQQGKEPCLERLTARCALSQQCSTLLLCHYLLCQLRHVKLKHLTYSTDAVCLQARQQSICVRHEDVVDNTTTWLVDFQEQFGLATKPGFPIEVLLVPPHAVHPRLW